MVDKKNKKQTDPVDDCKLKDIFLQITGKSMLPKILIKDHSYTIKTSVTINSKNEKTNKDGTYNLHFGGEQDGVAEIINYNGKRIVSTDRKSQSQKLRFQIFNLNKEDLKMNDPDFYDYIMTLFRHYCPELIDIVLRWKKEGK